MQACVDWVLKIFGTQVAKKKRSVRPVFADYLSVSYNYGVNKFYVNDYVVLVATVLFPNNRPTAAENLYYKGRFLQREVLKKNVVYFARRESSILDIRLGSEYASGYVSDCPSSHQSLKYFPAPRLHP